MCDKSGNKLNNIADTTQTDQEKLRIQVEEYKFKNCKTQCWMARLCRLPCQMITKGKPDTATCMDRCTPFARDMVDGMNQQSKAPVPPKQTVGKQKYEELRTLAVERIGKLPAGCLTKRTDWYENWKRIESNTSNCDPWTQEWVTRTVKTCTLKGTLAEGTVTIDKLFDYKSKLTDTLQACVDLCKETKKCAAVDRHTTDKTCFMKTAAYGEDLVRNVMATDVESVALCCLDDSCITSRIVTKEEKEIAGGRFPALY